MEAEELARTLVSALPKGVPGLFNPWADVCGEDLGSNGPAAKQRRLQQHLDCDADSSSAAKRRAGRACGTRGWPSPASGTCWTAPCPGWLTHRDG